MCNARTSGKVVLLLFFLNTAINSFYKQKTHRFNIILQKECDVKPFTCNLHLKPIIFLKIKCF